MNTQKENKGFTIIEVVLVLAIAGLIFLMIFIAWPALQRGQRDTQRRSDVGRFISQVSSYATNNNGKVPTASQLGTFKTSYLKWQSGSNGEFNDPKTGVGYVISPNLTAPTVDGAMSYAVGSGTRGYGCSGETATLTSNARQVAVMVKLEAGGVFCQSNL